MCNVLDIFLYMLAKLHVYKFSCNGIHCFFSRMICVCIVTSVCDQHNSNFLFFFYSPLQRNQTVRPPTAVEMRGRERRPEIGRGRASVGPAAESQPRSTAGLCGISDLCSVLSGAARRITFTLSWELENLWSGLILKDHSCFFSFFNVYLRRFIMKLYLHSLIFF